MILILILKVIIINKKCNKIIMFNYNLNTKFIKIVNKHKYNFIALLYYDVIKLCNYSIIKI